MEQLINTTNDSNMLPMVKNGKCLGCNDTTKDIDVLCCYLCKNRFHVLHCPVVEVMPTDVLPSKTDRGNYIKFCKKTFSSGNFIWTCFRCGNIKEIASKNNIDQRVSLLETLLLTLSPAIKSLSKSLENANSSTIEKLISEVRSSTSVMVDDDAAKNAPQDDANPSGNNPVIDSADQADHTTDAEISSERSVPASDLPPPSSDFPPPTPDLMPPPTVDPPPPAKARKSPPKHIGAKFRIRVKSKNETGPPLRKAFHCVFLSGQLDSIELGSIRFHSSHRADITFNNFTDAESAYNQLSSVLTDHEIGTPNCLNTKVIHVVGLTEDDKKETVYSAVCKPGRNRSIEHLINPSSFRVIDVSPCMKKPHVYRATVIVSADIWDTILNKMNSRLRIEYLSCSVFPRPDSIRCSRCQRLGHSPRTCTNEIACANCGGNHRSEGCVNDPKCINCSELSIECNHRADSSTCTAYKNFLNDPAKK